MSPEGLATATAADIRLLSIAFSYCHHVSLAGGRPPLAGR